MAEDVPDDCPFHHLEPGLTVWIELPGVSTYPISAEKGCGDWHASRVIRAALGKLASRPLERGPVVYRRADA